MPPRSYLATDTYRQMKQAGFNARAERDLFLQAFDLNAESTISGMSSLLDPPTPTAPADTRNVEPAPLPVVVSPRPGERQQNDVLGPEFASWRREEQPTQRATAVEQPASDVSIVEGEAPAMPQYTAGAGPSAGATPAPEAGGDLRAYARAQAQRYGVDPDIFERQITQESGWNPRAVSSAGAKGLGQFMPGTAASYGLTDPFDPYASLEAAARHMADNLKANKGDYRFALAAYNAGQGNVDRYGEGVFGADFANGQTRDYVDIILGPGSSGRPAPNAGAPGPAASPPSAPAAAATSPPPQAAGAPDDTVTIQHIDDGRRFRIKRANLDGYLQPPAPGVPVMWRVVEDGAEMQRQSLAEPQDEPLPGSRHLQPARPPTEVGQTALDEARGTSWARPGALDQQFNGLRELPRGPLSQQPELPQEAPYDPRLYDEGPGARELPQQQPAVPQQPMGYDDPGTQPASPAPEVGYVNGGPPPDDDSGQVVEMPTRPYPQIVQGGPPPDDGSGQVVETQIRPREPQAIAEEPPVLQQGMPSPNLKPVWDAAGAIIGYVQDVATKAGEIASSALGNVEEARVTTSAGLMEAGVGPAGMVPQRVLPRMEEIEVKAAQDTGHDLSTPQGFLTRRRAVNDPDWRAANPELAAEYDQLQQQFDLSVVGQAGDAGQAARAMRGAGRAAQNAAESPGPISRIRSALDANAERVAGADARATDTGSTRLPGMFGPTGSGPTDALTRSRVVPPEVADTLDFPIRLPDDPAVIRAIEAAGGSVDERGVTLGVTRAQSPSGAGQPATRGMVFYEAIPEGGRSSFVGGDDPTKVGGSQVIPRTPTRFRSPLIISDAPGAGQGFDDAMAQLNPGRWLTAEQRRLQSEAAMLAGQWDAAHAAYNAPRPSQEVDNAIRAARQAGPEGSPARAQALKDLVSTYGGDPSVIDDLLRVRGADASESAWAIKENIVAHNARRQGYDGVVTMQRGDGYVSEAAVATHPKVVAANSAIDEANAALREATAKIWERPTPETRRAYQQARKMLDDAEDAYIKAQDEAREELANTGRITELADVREAANPTPPSPTAELRTAYKRVKDAEAAWNDARSGRTATSIDEATRALEEAEAELERLMNAPDFPAPGYTLRSDLPRRPDAPRLAPEDRASLPLSSSLGAFGRTVNDEALNAAGGAFAGNLVSGDLIPDPNDTRTPQERINDALLHGGIGAVAAILTRRGLRKAGGAEGLRMAVGPQGPAGGGGLQNLPGVHQALQASQRRAARMAAAGQKPLNPLQWTGEAIKNVGYSSMIGPATATVNVLGNLLEPLWAVPKELTRSVVRGNPREFAEMTLGAWNGFRQSGREMLDAIRARGRYASNPDQPMLSERTINPIGHAFASATEAGGRLFSGLPDALFGTIARGAGEARRAAQIATDEGLKGAQWKQRVSTLLGEVEQHRAGQLTVFPQEVDDIITSGQQYADRQTFRDALGTWGKGASKWAGRDVPVIGNFLTPFFTTPWNMNITALERTPVGALMNRQKGFDKAYDATVGSTIIAGLVFGPAAAGQITGSGPDDPQKRQMLQAEGWKPYHTLIGDTYVPNRVFGIYGRLLNVVGDTHDYLAYQKKDAAARDLVTDAGKRVGKLIKEEPYLQGLADILDAFDSAGSGLEYLAGSNLARLVPYAATARTIGTAMDPSERTTDRGKSVPLAEGVGQRVESSLGMRSDLPVAQDTLGRPKENQQQGVWSVLPRLSPRKAEPTIAAFREAGVDIGFPKDKLTLDGIDIELTPPEQRRWQNYRGEILVKYAPGMRDKAWWSKPEAREAAMRDVLKQANEAADQKLMRDLGADAIRRRVREGVQKKRAS